MGFTHFAIEANMTEAFAVNEYVLIGKGSAKKALAGPLLLTWYTEEVLAMIEWMREYNQKHSAKVQFLGFDMQTDCGHCEREGVRRQGDPGSSRRPTGCLKSRPLFPKTPTNRSPSSPSRRRGEEVPGRGPGRSSRTWRRTATST